MQPKDQMSVRRSSGLPAACSGEAIGGRLLIEDFDLNTGCLSGVIKLNLAVIRRATVKGLSPNPQGYVPFDGLRPIERYAEVLGHEMAHLVSALEDRQYGRMNQEMGNAMNRFLHLLHERTKGPGIDEEVRFLTSRIESLRGDLERPAETAEAEIWRELRQSHGGIR